MAKTNYSSCLWVVRNFRTNLYSKPCRFGATHNPPVGRQVWKDLLAAHDLGPQLMGSLLSAFCMNQSSGKLMLRFGHGLFSRRILFSWQRYCGSECLVSCPTCPKPSIILCALLTLEALRHTSLTFLGILQEILFHLFNMMAYFTEMLVHVFCPAEVPAWRRHVQ